MGTVALVALLMALCNSRFTATHYALLSALAAVGRIYVSPVAGVLIESVGWPAFYLFSIAVAVPGVIMVRRMRAPLLALAGDSSSCKNQKTITHRDTETQRKSKTRKATV
jgi:PAT family beta-lactamase induction signal transducer AmpG